MELTLAYGRNGLPVTLPDDAVVVRPTDPPALDDEAGAVLAGLREPLAGPPLADIVRGAGGSPRVVVVFPDLTRPMPNPTVLPPLLAELERLGVRRESILLLCSTGTHRQATEAEMAALVGPEVYGKYTIHDHVSTDGDHVEVGRVEDTPVLLDRRYVEADVRIVTGFVEPHFFAGFSGGPKAVCPGVASLETILEAHNPNRIAHEKATWLEIEDNPVQQFIQAAVKLLPPSFSVDVAIDRRRKLTGVFAGALPDAHRRACAFVQDTSVQRVGGRFDVVVSTNGGFPLDRNLYQATKGMAAAERVVRDGGTVVLAAECSDGIPDEGGFKGMLERAATWKDLVDPNAGPELDRWSAQVMGRVLSRARLLLHADGLSDEVIRQSHLEPAPDVSQSIADALADAGPGARVCALPHGPFTVAIAD